MRDWSDTSFESSARLETYHPVPIIVRLSDVLPIDDDVVCDGICRCEVFGSNCADASYL